MQGAGGQNLEALMLQRGKQLSQLLTSHIGAACIRVDDQNREIQVFEHAASNLAYGASVVPRLLLGKHLVTTPRRLHPVTLRMGHHFLQYLVLAIAAVEQVIALRILVEIEQAQTAETRRNAGFPLVA